MVAATSVGADRTLPTRVFPRTQLSRVDISGDSNKAPIQPASAESAHNLTNPPDRLPPFNRVLHANHFGPRSNWDSEVSIPARPEAFNDEYLVPSLAEDEYARLTWLWYYTRDIQDDTELLDKLYQVLSLVKATVGWDVEFIGLVEAEHFTQVAAQNMPLTSFPRKESLCAHTINQEPGVCKLCPAP